MRCYTRTLKHLSCFAGLSCLILAGSTSAMDLSQLDSQVRYVDGVIEIDVAEALASDVVKVIGEKINVDVTVYGAIDARLTGRYTDDSIERLLEKMDLQYVLVWDAKGADRQLQEIVLLPEGAARSEFLNDKIAKPVSAKPETISSKVQDNSLDVHNDNKAENTLDNAADAATNGFDFSFDPAGILK